ncbi:MAG: hypothetical protein ABIQ08_17125 [Duganella sp.]
MQHNIVSHLFRAALMSTALASTLSACGGGGDGGADTPSKSEATITLGGAQSQTLAGGKALALTTSASDNSAVAWTLAAGAVGSLSATSGAGVNYVPPAAVAANTQVTVTATAAGVSRSVILTVFPDPGPAGLSIISGRLDPDSLEPETDGPLAAARFRESRQVTSDLGGNLYVAGTCRLTQTQRLGLSLRKIGTDNVVGTLASCAQHTWFGKADTDGNTGKVSIPRGVAADRAGNLYVATYFDATAGGASAGTRAVFKITPYGAMTVFAGATGAHTADLVDGKGAAARFLTPEIAGIDADDNLYLLDKDGAVVRKVTPAGEVGTIAALPASLSADQNGNTYRVDNGAGTIVQTGPTGAERVIANVRALPGALAMMTPQAYGLVRTGPASYALIVSNGRTFGNEAIVKLVTPK